MAKTKKIVTWTVTSVLVLFLILLGLVYVLPGYNLYLVRSESMVPAIRMGDLIVTGPVGGFINGTVKPGMIVTYQHGQDRITHRVASLSGSTVVMKGDALQHPDPWTVNLTDVTSIYLFKIPFIGFILNFVRTKLGWFLAIIGPTAVLVSLIIWEILKESFKDDKKVSEEIGIKPNAGQKKVSSSLTPVTISAARAESNARLRKILTEALEMQKTSNR
jgi:signal peptidase